MKDSNTLSTSACAALQIDSMANSPPHHRVIHLLIELSKSEELCCILRRHTDSLHCEAFSLANGAYIKEQAITASLVAHAKALRRHHPAALVLLPVRAPPS